VFTAVVTNVAIRMGTDVSEECITEQGASVQAVNIHGPCSVDFRS
jgi:hypothetical protein